MPLFGSSFMSRAEQMIMIDSPEFMLGEEGEEGGEGHEGEGPADVGGEEGGDEAGHGHRPVPPHRPHVVEAVSDGAHEDVDDYDQAVDIHNIIHQILLQLLQVANAFLFGLHFLD